jgi:hypothetical protein
VELEMEMEEPSEDHLHSEFPGSHGVTGTGLQRIRKTPGELGGEHHGISLACPYARYTETMPAGGQAGPRGNVLPSKMMA